MLHMGHNRPADGCGRATIALFKFALAAGFQFTARRPAGTLRRAER